MPRSGCPHLDDYVVDSCVVHFIRQHDAAKESKMQAALHAGLTE